MTTIVTRAGKGSPLTNNEMDTNLINLNTDKLETSTVGVSVQAYNAKLSAIAALANGNGFLKNDGSGNFSYTTYTETDTLASVTNRGNTTPAAISITNTTQSNLPSQGCLILSGGLGVAKNIYSSANITAYGNLIGSGATISGNAEIKTLSGICRPSTYPGFNFEEYPSVGYVPNWLFLNNLRAVTPTTTITANVTTATAFTAAKRYAVVVMTGGGKGGDYGLNYMNSFGGGAGMTKTLLIDLLQAASYSFIADQPLKYKATIGAGGTGGTSGTPTGGMGGDTIFEIWDAAGTTQLATYTTWGGGSNQSGVGYYNGESTSIFSNTLVKDGVLGTGTDNITHWAGYGGGASVWAAGGAGGNSAATPTAGTAGAANTGAGGGAGAGFGATYSNGGAGGSGVIKIYYI